MKKILGLFLGAFLWINAITVCATEKFDVLPDLPEPLAAAQASSISTTETSAKSLSTASQAIGQEPNILSVIFSLIFVILLIYATGIIYARLNKVGIKTLKKQIGEQDASRVSVVSSTPLGSNKTLHIVELDGKRMLLGASANGIHLIKDLGTYPPVNLDESQFSKIEIPNIRIPKIEIPKIEFPNIGFTHASGKFKSNESVEKSTDEMNEVTDDFQISEIYEESSDGIIDKLFTPNNDETVSQEQKQEPSAHSVDPDDYALYKKYL